MDVIIEEVRVIVGTGGTTPITPAEDQLLDDHVATGAETPSGAVAESLSQMNVGSPAAPAWSSKSRATVDYTLISVEPHGPT